MVVLQLKVPVAGDMGVILIPCGVYITSLFLSYLVTLSASVSTAA